LSVIFCLFSGCKPGRLACAVSRDRRRTNSMTVNTRTPRVSRYVRPSICSLSLTNSSPFAVQKVQGSCWIPGSYTPYTGLKRLILNGFFQRCRIGHDPRVEPVKTICYAKLDQLRPWNPISGFLPAPSKRYIPGLFPRGQSNWELS
jgi:hypothetical protein